MAQLYLYIYIYQHILNLKQLVNKIHIFIYKNLITISDVERLNTQLDQLNNALDVLEQKNENIQARLLELLKSNKELREEQSREES